MTARQRHGKCHGRFDQRVPDASRRIRLVRVAIEPPDAGVMMFTRLADTEYFRLTQHAADSFGLGFRFGQTNESTIASLTDKSQGSAGQLPTQDQTPSLRTGAVSVWNTGCFTHAGSWFVSRTG